MLVYIILVINLFYTETKEGNNIHDDPYAIEFFTLETTKKDLINQFGEQHIIQDTIFIEEEYYEIGTKIFPDTKNEVSIIWKDNWKT